MLPLARYRSLNTLGFSITLNHPDMIEAKWQWTAMIRTLEQFSDVRRENPKLRKLELFLGFEKKDVPALVKVARCLAWKTLVNILGARFDSRLEVGWEIEHFDLDGRSSEYAQSQQLRQLMKPLRDLVKNRLEDLRLYNIAVEEEWRMPSVSDVLRIRWCSR